MGLMLRLAASIKDEDMPESFVFAPVLAAAAAAPLKAHGSSFTEVVKDQNAVTASSSYIPTRWSTQPMLLRIILLSLSNRKAIDLYLDNNGKVIVHSLASSSHDYCLPGASAFMAKLPSTLSAPINASMNTNYGGLDQHGNGQLNYITKSSGSVAITR
ncbi:hypothetical protein BDZ89DRAFT_1165155 [Hymenopellis radicata]|nr:hypothetical protein BDZ89DRAFT_1165155 [Hymenopellis radicata]